MFKCDKCGECCRHLDASELYKGLYRGDGICRYLNQNICSIYEDRPLLCRIDDAYEVYFKSQMTKEEYYKLNYDGCQTIKNIKEDM